MRERSNGSANLLGSHGLRAYCVLKAYKEESAYTKYELLTLINHTDYQLIKYLVYAVYAKINKKNILLRIIIKALPSADT